MLSDYRYFKFVDESVQAFSQFSDNPVYYYYYTHRGQYSLTNRLNVPAEKDFGTIIFMLNYSTIQSICF